ncbi:serine hydrolase domain-containing protein [Sphingosinicella rhizophila]|uniref:Serine hydrolase domain-containing protein n=1 Tax=Sphingosinicella rhizophila TaxID=3050082 RepID=A0ABU3Q5R0_9SPHN|nr:serine hydrolase domain-containing protein [Sphingosinicella sp. GR2756]MDT9598740.1 serine hydrolase domain-containing protein [Sphingosinicella sp. GR2756]
MSAIRAIEEQLSALLGDPDVTRGVAGAVIGVSIGDEQAVLPFGSANLNTGQPFTEDTGFLLGSVTKVLVTMALLRLVERGLVDLDAPAQNYVPEFTLNDPDAAARITVRMLVNHTNGIDSDSLCPVAVRGRDASKSYTAHLPRIGLLFEPGTSVSYSNPGFVLAARIIEEVTGQPFERAIQTELFDPAGMGGATALQTQAFLRRTAVGATFDPATGGLRASSVFTLGEGLAGGGTTLIVSPQDMLTFGRIHLNGGVAPNGTHVLGEAWVSAMRATEFDLGVPPTPPVGLGWWAYPIAGTTAYSHAGGSPGGVSNFSVLPDYDATIISFATGPGTGALNDIVHTKVIESLTGRKVTPPFDVRPEPIDPALAGEYRTFQRNLTVAVRGDELVVTGAFEPWDDEHREQFKERVAATPPETIFRSIGSGRFIRAGTEAGAYAGILGRGGVITALPATATRRAGLMYEWTRFMPRTG